MLLFMVLFFVKAAEGQTLGEFLGTVEERVNFYQYSDLGRRSLGGRNAFDIKLFSPTPSHTNELLIINDPKGLFLRTLFDYTNGNKRHWVDFWKQVEDPNALLVLEYRDAVTGIDVSVYFGECSRVFGLKPCEFKKDYEFYEGLREYYTPPQSEEEGEESQEGDRSARRIRGAPCPYDSYGTCGPVRDDS